ncbi:hypothetical protein [Brevibacillus sp. SYSU BS000544]|uniref:hypothetical protein n=1 Tax=Brevibacillus sp. SYSU BS000544 TaxID=3416443 RepID=UPI003CE4C68F
MDTNWAPKMDLSFLDKADYSWAYSEDFNNYIKPASFVGNFYLDMESGVLYFEVER